MKLKIFFLGLLAFTISGCVFSPKQNSEQKTFDYLGQIPPSDSMKIFAPGIICDTATKESAIAISPNGDEVFFVRGEWPNTKIMHMSKSGDKWSLPDTAEFSKDCWCTEPAFSPDGKYLYFSTSKGKTDITFYSLWRIEKNNNNWSKPERLFNFESDSIWEFHPTVTKNNLLYFCYWDAQNSSGDIYVSECIGGKCSEPKKLAAPINSEYSDVDPFVSKDGSFMIYTSNRPDGYGRHDQYVSFKNKDGTWSELKNLGAKFNNAEDNFDLDLTPDGQYILLYLKDDIYWMQSESLLSGFE